MKRLISPAIALLATGLLLVGSEVLPAHATCSTPLYAEQLPAPGPQASWDFHGFIGPTQYGDGVLYLAVNNPSSKTLKIGYTVTGDGGWTFLGGFGSPIDSGRGSTVELTLGPYTGGKVWIHVAATDGTPFLAYLEQYFTC